MTLVSKNVLIHKLDEIVNKYSNTYHRTIRMKPVKYIDISRESNDKGAKFEVGDHVITSKCESIFLLKYILQTGLKKVF